MLKTVANVTWVEPILGKHEEKTTGLLTIHFQLAYTCIASRLDAMRQETIAKKVASSDVFGAQTVSVSGEAFVKTSSVLIWSLEPCCVVIV